MVLFQVFFFSRCECAVEDNGTFRLLSFRVKDNGVWIIENVFKWLTGNLYRLLSPGGFTYSSCTQAARYHPRVLCVSVLLQPLCVCVFLAESLKSDMSVVVNVRVLITRVCLLTRVSTVMRQCVSL